MIRKKRKREFHKTKQEKFEKRLKKVGKARRKRIRKLVRLAGLPSCYEQNIYINSCMRVKYEEEGRIANLYYNRLGEGLPQPGDNHGHCAFLKSEDNSGYVLYYHRPHSGRKGAHNYLDEF